MAFIRVPSEFPTFVLRAINTLEDVYSTLKNIINSYNDFRKAVIDATNSYANELDALSSASYFDSGVDGGTYDLSLSQFFHLVDAGSTPVSVNLPDPSDADSIGKRVVIKRNNTGGNAVTVIDIERGNNVALSAQDYYVELFSNGADWWIISERR